MQLPMRRPQQVQDGARAQQRHAVLAAQAVLHAEGEGVGVDGLQLWQGQEGLDVRRQDGLGALHHGLELQQA
jgi:hypothetical protein